MWIKTESGVLLNADRVVLFEAGRQGPPGSSSYDPDYADMWIWTVRAVLEGDEVVLAKSLSSATSEVLMERLWCAVRYAKYVSVPAELAAIRADQEAHSGAQPAIAGVRELGPEGEVV